MEFWDVLSPDTSDLQFRASRDRYGGQPLFSERFPGLWAGARSTHGVTRGRVCFQARVSQILPGKEGSSEVWRTGNSRNSGKASERASYGFDGRGLKVENGKFQEFGESFGESDVIGCFADFEDPSLVSLSFSKNGRDLGAAFRVRKDSLRERALLPHVLCKGCAVELNFGQRPEPLAPVPDGFLFIHHIPAPDRVRTPPGPKSTEECEVLLMVGLPGSGKTQWAQKHSQENREKRYNILGTERVLHQLTLLTQQAAQCLSKLVQIAPRARRNFILDQVSREKHREWREKERGWREKIAGMAGKNSREWKSSQKIPGKHPKKSWIKIPKNPGKRPKKSQKIQEIIPKNLG
uniref:B30.2/SPRY domain-containing protein n=1 Tax=Cyanistes caeruleus TaxID=156563 RepID=A0A8C0V706_CYACU